MKKFVSKVQILFESEILSEYVEDVRFVKLFDPTILSQIKMYGGVPFSTLIDMLPSELFRQVSFIKVTEIFRSHAIFVVKK